jgi:hypothetical protein
MDTPEVVVARSAAQIAMWALWVSGGSLLIAASAFALELRRRFGEGVRLALKVSPDMVFVGGGHETEGRIYLSLTVTNKGTASTTITNMVLFCYPSRLSIWMPHGLMAKMLRHLKLGEWLNRRKPQTMIVTRPGGATGSGEIPHVLTPGMLWRGVVEQTPELVDMLHDRRLYVGVSASHRHRPLLKRARPRKRRDGPPAAEIHLMETPA